MDKNIVYLKEKNNFDDILKSKHNKMPMLFKKIIFVYKHIFNIITKKKNEENEIWVLPTKEEFYRKEIEYILKKKVLNSENKFLVSKKLKEKQINKIMQEYNIQYISEEKIKKFLLIDILNYITNIQNKKISDVDLTILVNNSSNLNIYLIEQLAKLVKTMKIVSSNIYKFKKIEEKLFDEYGIAIQFSNSYKKSLEKAKIIINLDFLETEINEYDIFDKAIIINCIDDYIKIKSKRFEGITINSYEIEFNPKNNYALMQSELKHNYTNLSLYASIIEKEENFLKIFEYIKKDNLNIVNLIGNSGDINKNEFENIEKSLTKI